MRDKRARRLETREAHDERQERESATGRDRESNRLKQRFCSVCCSVCYSVCCRDRESDHLKQRYPPPSFFYTHAHVTHT